MDNEEIPIRAVSRSLQVMRLINQHESLSMMEVSRLSQLPYPTTSRIVQTLVHEGLLCCEQVRKRYRATELVKALSASYLDRGDLREVARPYLLELTERHNWPVIISNQVGQSVEVQDSTYGLTSTAFNIYPTGYRIPLLECAAGHAYLAFADDQTRDCLLRGLEHVGSQHPALERFKSGHYAEWIREFGFAAYERTMSTANPGKTSAISVPLKQTHRRHAQISLSYISSAMTMAEAVKRYAEPLRNAAAAIEIAFARGH
ncbi:helix-turn-helix domain-containing protein [Pseudomonas sp. TH10]|uniref:helix-turn-helix domain-containing protein n=1 Tax=Pseudomonas sp. TH10 TaxID=2796376 RepID=UPI001912451B|nr:helix-turn-helix domain-containing protein [Pseudomonas sp. TH10]MBK5517924.1 helix-turn-helix domain-containing protein [Pseudomonas sp. TH10]